MMSIKIPKKITNLVEDGTWNSSFSLNNKQREFLKNKTKYSPVSDFRLYSIDVIKTETLTWRGDTDEMWQGTKSWKHRPGKINKKKGIIICDLDPEDIICLYKNSAFDEKILHLENFNNKYYWVELFPDLKSFLKFLFD